MIGVGCTCIITFSFLSQSQLGERDEDRYISQDVCVTVLDGTKGVMRRAQVVRAMCVYVQVWRSVVWEHVGECSVGACGRV